jgi:hypothetical protein
MKSWWIALGCTAVLGIAQAQDAPPAGGKGGAHEACKPDVEKFCSDVKAGGGRIISCMRQHKEELSQACKDAIGHGSKGPPPGADQPAPKQ